MAAEGAAANGNVDWFVWRQGDKDSACIASGKAEAASPGGGGGVHTL